MVRTRQAITRNFQAGLQVLGVTQPQPPAPNPMATFKASEYATERNERAEDALVAPRSKLGGGRSVYGMEATRDRTSTRPPFFNNGMGVPSQGVEFDINAYMAKIKDIVAYNLAAERAVAQYPTNVRNAWLAWLQKAQADAAGGGGGGGGGYSYPSYGGGGGGGGGGGSYEPENRWWLNASIWRI